MTGLTTPEDIQTPPTIRSLDGAIILFIEEYLLAFAKY
jgi:hypothetical protein